MFLLTCWILVLFISNRLPRANSCDIDCEFVVKNLSAAHGFKGPITEDTVDSVMDLAEDESIDVDSSDYLAKTSDGHTVILNSTQRDQIEELIDDINDSDGHRVPEEVEDVVDDVLDEVVDEVIEKVDDQLIDTVIDTNITSNDHTESQAPFNVHDAVLDQTDQQEPQLVGSDFIRSEGLYPSSFDVQQDPAILEWEKNNVDPTDTVSW